MDFQVLLNIAARNKAKAEKEATVSRRYTTALPPPKKEKRTGVDQSAIRARLEKKQHDKKQEALKEESKKQELLKLRAETKKKSKKSLEILKGNGQQQNGRQHSSATRESYDDSKHEVKHRSFMKKVEKVVERTRHKDEDEVVSRKAPERPKKPKTPAAAQKGPMSYKQLLALAADQQKSGREPGEKQKARNKTAKQNVQKAPKQPSEMDVKKAIAARKLGEMRRQEFLAQRRGAEENSENGSARKSKGPTTNGTTKQYKINGEKVKSELQRINSSGKKVEPVTSKPETSTSKTKHSPMTSSGPKNKSAGSLSKSVPNNDDRRQKQKQPLERRKPPMTLTQSTVKEHFDKAPSGHRPRQVQDRRPEPRQQSKMDKYFDRVPSSSRPQPGSDRRGPSMGHQMPRKRPASSAPSFHAKRGRLLSEEESDYEEDGFIDDTPLEEEGGENISKYIKEIFGYDKSKYGYESDHALRNMEANYRDIQKEEARSSRIGRMEDLEDIKREKEENKRLAQKKKKR